MADKKKMIEALECCVSPLTNCNKCPYGVNECMRLKRDLLEELKPDSELIAIWDEVHGEHE